MYKFKCILFLFIPIACFSQRQLKLATADLCKIEKDFGIDSVLKLIEPFSDICLIDTVTALKLALKCKDITHSPWQFDYFCSTGQRIKDKAFDSTSSLNIQNCKRQFFEQKKGENPYFIIPDEFLHILVFQQNVLQAQNLKLEFDFWEHQSDSIRKQFPSKAKRFFQSFKGASPIEMLYGDCKENSYKIAWSLNKLGAEGFPLSKVENVRSELVGLHRNHNMGRTNFEMYSSTKIDTFKLSKSYSSLAEIDFRKEKLLNDSAIEIANEYCWQKLFINNSLGILEAGCQYAPLSGHGKVLKMELIKSNVIIVTIITEWVS